MKMFNHPGVVKKMKVQKFWEIARSLDDWKQHFDLANASKKSIICIM